MVRVMSGDFGCRQRVAHALFMDDKRIHEYGTDATGKQVSRGYYAISPAGHLVLLPPSAPLKEGFRVATTADVAEKEKCAVKASAKPEVVTK